MTNRKLPAHIRAGLPGNVILFCIVPLLSRHRREGVRSGQVPNKYLPAGRYLLFVIWYHFSLFKNEFQKPKKLKESP